MTLRTDKDMLSFKKARISLRFQLFLIKFAYLNKWFQYVVNLRILKLHYLFDLKFDSILKSEVIVNTKYTEFIKNSTHLFY